MKLSEIASLSNSMWQNHKNRDIVETVKRLVCELVRDGKSILSTKFPRSQHNPSKINRGGSNCLLSSEKYLGLILND